MAQARTLALSGGKSPKCLGGNLGDFGEFCKGLIMTEISTKMGTVKKELDAITTLVKQ